MNRLKPSPEGHAGFSMVELLVSMAVGFILLGGVLQVFTSSYAASRIVSAHSGQQENTRVALDVLTRDMRLAGHYGGIDASEISILGSLGISGVGSCNQAWITDTDFPIRGYEGASAISSVSDLPSNCISNDHYVANTDLFVMRYASPSDVAPIGGMDASTVYLRTSLTSGVTGGELLLGSNVSNTKLGFGIDGVGIYNYEYKTDLYYLRPCSALNSGSCSDGISSLVKLSLNGSTADTQAIAENVEQFQVEYGVDSDADFVANTFEKADAVSNWNNVVSLKFSLVVRSEQKEASVNDTTTYSLAGDYSYTPPSAVQNYSRKAYTKVIYLRNMSRG